jgi:hypothetical protein
MSKSDVLLKLLSRASGIEFRSLKTRQSLTKEQAERVAEAEKGLKRSILGRLKIVDHLRGLRPNLVTENALRELIWAQLRMLDASKFW